MSSTAASAHIPNPSASAVHSAVEWPPRDAITAVSGASASSIAIEVASRVAGGRLYPISAKPDATLKTLARVAIGLRPGAPYS